MESDEVSSTDDSRIAAPQFEAELLAAVPHLRRYIHALLATTRSPMDADDLVRSTVERGLPKIANCRPGSDVRVWLLTTLHNLYVDELQRGRRQFQVPGPVRRRAALPIVADPSATAESSAVTNALARLPREQREVILLVGLEGLRYAEVATVLGVPMGTVRSRLSRGREALRRLLGAGDARWAR